MVHPKKLASTFAVLCTAASVLACGGGGDNRGGGSCPAGLVPGDLVITEIMANPDGADDSREWFEIYNASDDIDLTGVLFALSKADGESQKVHEVDGLVIQAGSYVAVGDIINDPVLLPSHLMYGYARELGSFNNSGGQLAILCEDTFIDEVTYEMPTDSASRGFDGLRAPDASGNDDISAWCDAQTPLGEVEFGTPGAQNDACFGSAPTSCEEDGSLRDIIAPVVGDLVITEFHANPSSVPDDVGEWVEVFVANTVDLNGLEIGTTIEMGADGAVNDSECLTVQAGSYIVFARESDPAVNGGLDRVDYAVGIDLRNSGDNTRLYIGRGGEILDEITWTTPRDGASSNLDPDRFDVTANDDEGNFCDAETPYGDGDLGTPGAANIECAIAPPAGQCSDGGELRPVMAPAAGDLVITEFMANPAAVDDNTGEWIEIRANAAVDLNGLELGTVEGEVRDTIEVEECITLGSGDYAVLARTEDGAMNGSLPQVDATFGFAVGNSNGSLFIGYDGAVLDSFAYATTANGAATALDPSFTDPANNDDEANWCSAVDSYGDGDFGTPGAENSDCGSTTPGTCDDGGNERDVVSPGVGDLVITEFMANPSAVPDSDGEYFELLALGDFDLNALQMGRDEGDVEDTLPGGGPCLSVSNGDRVVIAKSTSAATNGGISDVFGTFSFGLVNDNRGIWVGIDGTTVDVITYTSTSAGAASSLDPDMEDAVSNDDQGNFCNATSSYGDGDLGTPGAANDVCIGGNTCLDGGTPRAIVPPVVGDLVINEFMANPTGSDTDREWFELRVESAGDIDLNGLELYHTDTVGVFDLEQTINAANCITVTTDDLVLFARNPDDALANGGLPAGGIGFSFGLVHTSDRGLAVGHGGATHDEVTWSSSNISEGTSRTLAAGEDDVSNDNEANWCDGSSVYGDGDLGTPDATNDVCP